MDLRIYSLNVNGLRSAMSKGFDKWLLTEQPDIICLQEIKAFPEQIDTSEIQKAGYQMLWHPAEKTGYSGVAVFTKVPPDATKVGMGIPEYDREGRMLQLHYPQFTLLCTYFPSGTMGDVRQEVKMAFLEEFLQYLKNLKNTHPRVIISGDFNICHKPIDINHPERHTKMSGFLPEEREWMDRFVAEGFVDTFRVFNQQPEQYSWWSFRAGAREKNLGWRIDYHFVTENMRPHLAGAAILSSVYLSDHCPVVLELNI